MQTSIDRHRWNDVREWVRDPGTRRDWDFAANDGASPRQVSFRVSRAPAPVTGSSSSPPFLSGLATCLSFVVGALIPLLITYYPPLDIETWAILGTVAIALALTSIASARSTHVSTARTLGRSLVVGGVTLLVSYIAGELLLG